MNDKETLFQGRVFEMILDGKLVEIGEEHIVHDNSFIKINWPASMMKALSDHCKMNPK